MKVLNYEVFVDAVLKYTGEDKDIKALFTFLRAANICSVETLENLFPDAVENTPGQWMIRFAKGKLFFNCTVDLERNFILSKSITDKQQQENKHSG